jgi:hypothetical protein
MGLGLVIGFIEHLQIVTASNYGAIANSHTHTHTHTRARALSLSLSLSLCRSLQHVRNLLSLLCLHLRSLFPCSRSLLTSYSSLCRLKT